MNYNITCSADLRLKFEMRCISCRKVSNGSLLYPNFLSIPSKLLPELEAAGTGNQEIGQVCRKN